VAVGTSPLRDALVLRLGQTCSQPLYEVLDGQLKGGTELERVK
jgi:hypothetical protein